MDEDTTPLEFNVDDVEDEVTEEAVSGYNGIMITATPEFKDAMKVAAAADDKSLSSFARQILAAHIGYSGPLSKGTTRAKKYSSPEERDAAQKNRNKARRDVIKALLQKYGDEVKAQLEAPQG